MYFYRGKDSEKPSAAEKIENEVFDLNTQPRRLLSYEKIMASSASSEGENEVFPGVKSASRSCPKQHNPVSRRKNKLILDFFHSGNNTDLYPHRKPRKYLHEYPPF